MHYIWCMLDAEGIRYLKEAEILFPDASWIEGQDALILRLRRDHGHKWKFWGRYDAD